MSAVNELLTQARQLNDHDLYQLQVDLLKITKLSRLRELYDEIKSLLSFDIIEKLPSELVDNILSHLDAKSLCSVSLCCKKWRNHANSNNLWYKLCVREGYTQYEDLPIPQWDDGRRPSSPRHKPYDISHMVTSSDTCQWKMVYVKATVLLRNWSCGIYNISLLKEHNEPITALVTEGNICVTGSRNGICKIWDTSSLTSISSLTGHTDEISTISIKDGLVITGCSDGVVRVFSAMTSQCLWCLTTTSSVDVITYNGSVIVAATSDLSLYVWTLDKCHPTLHGTLQGHTQQLTCLVMSCSESNICVSGSWDGTLRIWDTKRMMNCHILLAHDEGVLCVLVLSNGTIVSGGSDCTVKQWNISNGHLIMTLSGHKQEVLCLQATDDVIISSSADSTIRIWNYEGKCVNVLSEHIGLVRCLRINGDDVLVSGGDRKKINVWSIKSGRLLHTVHRQQVILHLLSTNKTQIITASPDAGTLSIIDYW